MTCDHVRAVGGDYDGAVILVRQSGLDAAIARAHEGALRWASGVYALPAIANAARSRTPAQNFLKDYTACQYCPECGEKLPEIS